MKQDIRELHVGFLNMMPDAALSATEQQFIRFIGACNQIAQIYVYPFSLPELNRGPEAEAHIAKHYSEFEDLAARGLDALIITGANVTNPSLDQEEFWDPLMKIVTWAEHNVASVLCSCLATHALVKHHHGIDRSHMGRKTWGVYSHKISLPSHPLMRDVNTRFDAPHSRYNEIPKVQLEDAGLAVLVESDDVGVHLAVSPDLFRIVYFQGHPEYDAISLLKEYKREVQRFLTGNRQNYPPFPEHYLDEAAKRRLDEFQRQVTECEFEQATLPAFPEEELSGHYFDTWGAAGRMIFSNWLGSLTPDSTAVS